MNKPHSLFFFVLMEINMDREDVIYKKAKYQYGMRNVLFKGLEKDKVYRMRRNGIVYMYIINEMKDLY